MNISIFGLGYVGCVSAACLAQLGHKVIGVDVNPIKVKAIFRGQSPIVEPDLGDLIRRGVENDKLAVTTKHKAAVMQTDASIICVGTPSRDNGGLDLTYVERVARQIAEAFKEKTAYHTIIFRSTVVPGTTEGVVQPILEKWSEKKAGIDFSLAFNPEFLREGSGVKDFYHPSRTVIGAQEERGAQLTQEVYRGINAPVVVVDILTAEMVKYTDNAFHALKVAFANEIGRICKSLGIDSHKVKEIFLMDANLNISAAYLKPGFAFGGSCLPKDLRALVHEAQERDVEVPLLKSILKSNEIHKRVAFEMVKRTGKRKVGLIGLSFKGGTDDLRESPAVALAEMLIGKGYDLLIYDPNVSLSKLIGANKEYIQKEIPHIDKLMDDSLEEVLNHAEVIVLTYVPEELMEFIPKLRGEIVIDFARIEDNIKSMVGSYEGICW